MKKWLLIMGLLGLLGLVGCQREVEESSLYQRYAQRTDLTVAQVEGFRLGDTVRVDVVILVADDSAAWQSLKDELDIRTSAGVTSWMGDIDEPARRVKRSVRPAWRAMAVHDERTVAFYRIDSEAQRQALLDYQLQSQSEQ